MNRLNKIVHLTTVHPPFDTRIFHKEAKTLARAGYDVTLIAQHERDEVVDGVRIVALPKPRNRFNRIFGLTWRVFWLALRQKADVYHFHDPELIPVGLWLHLRGAYVIYDVHEDLPRQILSKHWIPGWLRGVIARGAELVERVASRSFPAIVVATPAIARRFPPNKTVVVQNYPILKEIQISEAEPYARRPPIVAYVGGITPIRGTVEMVRAMELLPDDLRAKLVLAGTFSPAWLGEELRKLAAWARVDFLGWLPREQVIRLLGKARVGLALFHPVPNHTEAQPNKLFEYMSAGIPVVASDFPLWREIVEGNRCGMTVDPLDPKEIARAIEYLITHPEEARRMGENGRSAVRDKYNWEQEKAKLLRIYKEVEEKR